MPLENSRRRLLYALLVAAVLLLALALRLRGLDTTALWGDQAFTLNTAMRWVNGGPMPLAANKSSVGFVNPPMIEYLYAAALFLWGDILSVSLLTMLGGLAAVAVTGFVTARLFGRRAGLWAALAFAVAPWAVYWSQLIWNQTMVPPFAALTLGGLLLYLFDRPRPAYLIASFAAAAAMTQVHPGTAIQLLIFPLALLAYRRRVRWTHVLAGAAVFALLYAPYLLYQIGTGWADVRALRDMAGQGARFSGAALLLSLDLLRAQGLYRGAPYVRWFDALAVGLFVAALIIVVARLLDRTGFERTPVRRPGRSDNRGALAILLLWWALPILFYLRSAVYLQNYYLVGQWPAHFMIIGIGLDTAQRAIERLAGRTQAKKPVLRVAASWLPALPFLALFAYQTLFAVRYQDARAAEDNSLLQVRQMRLLIDQSRRLLAERPACRLVGVGRGHQVENSDLALLQEFVDPTRVLLTDGDLALPLPQPCAVYVNTRPGSPAAYWLLDQAQPIDDAPLAAQGDAWQFYDWTAPPPPDNAITGPQWEIGLTLDGHFHGDLAAGQGFNASMVWRVLEPPGGVYHFGAYLLDENNVVVAQHDGPGFDSIQWRAGDSFVTWFTLPIPDDLPAANYRLAVALYRAHDLARANLVGGGNTAYLEALTPQN